MTQPLVFGCWLGRGKVKFERLTAPDVSVCLQQLVDLPMKLYRRTWFSLPFAEFFLFPGKVFQPWACWWPLAMMFVLKPQALPTSLEWWVGVEQLSYDPWSQLLWRSERATCNEIMYHEPSEQY